MIVGKRELVEVAAINSFIGFETSGHLTIGRPMKVDRQEIVATVVALREWLAMDHEDRLARYGERIDYILGALNGVKNVEAYRISEREQPRPVVRDGVRIVTGGVDTAAAVEERLRHGEPSIWVGREANLLNVSVAFFDDADLPVVAECLRDALSR
jgi:seryl-tRNA(Sec) selenium transferase